MERLRSEVQRLSVLETETARGLVFDYGMLPASPKTSFNKVNKQV